MHEIWKGSGGEEPLTVGGLATVPRKRTCIEELEVIDQPHLLTLFVDHIPHFLSQKRLGPPTEQEAAYAELVEPQEVDCI